MQDDDYIWLEPIQDPSEQSGYWRWLDLAQPAWFVWSGRS